MGPSHGILVPKILRSNMATKPQLHSPHPPRNTLKILQWNANGIMPRLTELKNYLATQHVQPDVICLQETHLTEKTKLKLPSYYVERRDRGGGEKHGGVATLLKSDLIYSVIENIEDIEEISVSIKLQNQEIIISNIYNPPRKEIEEAKYNQVN